MLRDGRCRTKGGGLRTLPAKIRQRIVPDARGRGDKLGGKRKD